MTLSIFSLIGIILLFGLVTKNSILLVDYANQLRAEGMDKVEAMRTAAPIRMRPVLMTGLSMIFGVLPAALGIGPGAETRAPMAVATAARHVLLDAAHPGGSPGLLRSPWTTSPKSSGT